MPFPSALIGGDLTRIRGGGQYTRYLVMNTPTILLQFQPDIGASGRNNGVITFSIAASGATTNVLIGMTVIISPTNDPVVDLKNQPENCELTYVRALPELDRLYIGMTNFQWTTSQFVTVYSDFRVFEKPILNLGTNILKDYGVDFRPPLPRIYDIYWDVVITTGATFDYSPTPSADAMASGATISSWFWQVIENGVLTHTSALQNPTFTLDVGIHWLHLTVTDSNGNTNWFAAFIAVVPSTYDSVVHQAIAGTVTNNLDSGISSSLIAYGDVSAWLPGSAGIIFMRAIYADATDEQFVEMAGWLSEASDNLRGSEQWGIEQTFNASFIGIADALNRIRLPGYPTSENATPSEWGEFLRVSPYDALWYAGSEHSTAFNVSACDLPSNYADFQFGSITVPGNTLQDVFSTLAFRATGGLINWSPNGEMFFRKSLLYESSDTTRDAATMITTFTTADVEVLDFQFTPPNVFAFGAIHAGLASFNTTTKQPTVASSQAPGGFVPGALLEQIDGIILTEDLSIANTLIQSGKFAANHFFAATDSTMLSLDLLQGYYVLQPSAFEWYQVTSLAPDMLYGHSFGVNDRWLYLSRSVTVNPEDGSLSVRGTLRRETDGGDNYAPETKFIPFESQHTLPPFPVASGYPGLIDFVPDDALYGDRENNVGGWEDNSLPAEQATEEAIDPSIDETIYVPMNTGTTVTTVGSFTGSVLLRISGDAAIGTTDSVAITVLGTDNPKLTGINVASGDSITYSATGSWKASPIGGSSGPNGSGTAAGTRIEPPANVMLLIGKIGDGEYFSIGASSTSAANASGELQLLANDLPTAYGDNSGSVDVTITLPAQKGDAFYFNYQGGGSGEPLVGAGLTVDAAAPTRPDFRSDHQYEITVGVTGTIDFLWTDPDGDYSDNESRSLRVDITQL
jgi:hypothetical protein